MAGPRSAKKAIPTLIRSHGDSEEKIIAFGRHMSKAKEPHKIQRSTNRTAKSLGSQDLTEENNMLRESLQKLDKDHRRMEQELEETVRDAHDRLATMKELLEKREKIYAGTLDEVSKKNEKLENQVAKYEEKLLSNNINPVNLENLDPTSIDEQGVEEHRKIAKGKVKQMREKLKDMNQKTQTYLDDLQSMKRQIEELEGVSSRLDMGDNSDDENVDDKRAPLSTVFLTQSDGST